MEIFRILIYGFLFGAILQYARLNRFNVISGLATLEDLSVAKAIALAVGLGAILLSVEIGLGMASWHIKPFVLGGIMLGGLIFGSGMAILGYCPGTMAISFGEGSMDAFTGILGGLTGGWIYTLVLPSIHPVLGPDLGKISFHSLFGNGFLYWFLVIMVGIAFIIIAYWLHKVDKNTDKNKKWVISGIALALLEVLVFLKTTTNRPVGASTSYPYVADLLTGATHNDYFSKVQKPGHWELIFLAGAFLAGLIISLIKKDFRFTLVHNRWEKHKGTSPLKRIIWSFTGGFILIFGARMAGGCTSGHILSGGMQLAISSLAFAVFVFAGLLITGKVFYKTKE